ncbi:MAG: hypothetical protein ACD_78C00135G0002 [uncultured bacterium (gcode 4)]|uniref:LTXXQ motif family protein n=1 Tax=uncultured bacterium (gcode 4) TaxID=1234023 RepID=K1XZ02_9BACT|nr:MAG: hypothetical protein ACD_78C00135G0002 [uncultured bacterium (gcode 4)]
MKTKILAGVVLVTLATAGTLTYAASTNTGATNILRNTFSGMHQTGSGGFNNKGHQGRLEAKGIMRGMGWSGMMGKWMASKITDTEKTKLATMTDAEKKAFLETKMTEQKALRDTKEVVIDKLINGETLTDTEKITLATIRTERATAKADRVAREKQMTEIQPIVAKVKAGTTLTTDEQKKLNAFKATMKQNNKEGRGGKSERRDGIMGQ